MAKARKQRKIMLEQMERHDFQIQDLRQQQSTYFPGSEESKARDSREEEPG